MIRPTRQRGLRDAYGSWKIIWMRARSRRRAAAWRGSVIETPVIVASPAEGGSRPTTIRATVDLPEPDSPTIAKVSPFSIVNPDPVDRREEFPGLALEHPVKPGSETSNRRRQDRCRST